MITQAMQGVVPVLVGAGLGWGLLRWMASADGRLPHGFEDKTADRERWAVALAPEGQPKLRSGVRA